MDPLGSELRQDDPSVSWKRVEGGLELRRSPAQHSQDQDWAQGEPTPPDASKAEPSCLARAQQGLREVNTGLGEPSPQSPRALTCDV